MKTFPLLILAALISIGAQASEPRAKALLDGKTFPCKTFGYPDRAIEEATLGPTQAMTISIRFAESGAMTVLRDRSHADGSRSETIFSMSDRLTEKDSDSRIVLSASGIQTSNDTEVPGNLKLAVQLDDQGEVSALRLTRSALAGIYQLELLRCEID